MATTPVYALPYPVGTDLVRDGDNVIQALAERVEALLAPRDALPNFRNVLRNGDHTVWQRGPGPFTAPGFAAHYADGWKHVSVGTGATSQADRQQDNYDVNLGGLIRSRFHTDVLVTGATTADAQSIIAMQSIEGFPFVSNSDVMLSFTMDVSTACTIYAELLLDGGTLTGVVTPNVVPIAVTPGAKRYTVALKMPTYGGAGNVTTDSLRFSLWAYCGSTSATGFRAPMLGMTRPVAVRYSFGEIQLELGTIASPFERLPQALQEYWCRRYYVRYDANASNNAHFMMGVATSAANIYFPIAFNPVMRTTPTITWSGVGSSDGAVINKTNVSAVAFQSGYASPQHGLIAVTLASGATAHWPEIMSLNGAGAYIAFSAEL